MLFFVTLEGAASRLTALTKMETLLIFWKVLGPLTHSGASLPVSNHVPRAIERGAKQKQEVVPNVKPPQRVLVVQVLGPQKQILRHRHHLRRKMHSMNVKNCIN
jgi:hypothetical protein